MQLGRLSLHRRWLVTVGCLAALTAVTTVGIVQLQHRRANAHELVGLVTRVQAGIEHLKGQVAQVMRVVASPDLPPRAAPVESARAAERELAAAEDQLRAAAPDDPRLAILVADATSYRRAVITVLDAVPTITSPDPHWREVVLIRHGELVEPSLRHLDASLARESGRVRATSETAYGQATWGSLAILSGMVLLLAGLLWRGTRRRLRAARRFESLISNMSDIITVLDRSGRVTYQSPSLTERLGGGGPPRHVLTDIVHPEDAPLLTSLATDPHPVRTRPLELRVRHVDGAYHLLETQVTDLTDDPAVRGVVLTSRDVTERLALEGRLAEMAYRDPLTGLGNRALLHQHLQHLLGRPCHDPGALLFVDLDDFKSVNDTLGHGAGDDVLRLVGERLRHLVRGDELIVRLGGDEFALVLDRGSPGAAQVLSERILRVFDSPFSVAYKDIRMSASVGIREIHAGTAGGPAAPISVESLLRDADIALYAAKGRGKGRWETFDPTMQERTCRRVELLTALRQAVDQGSLDVYYQPLVDLSTGTVHSLEALLRWEHHGAMVSPEVFIPLAEENGLIVELGRWALLRACSDLISLHRSLSGTAGLSVAVNVSARQLSDAVLVHDVGAALTANRLPPPCLTIEITESLLAECYDETALLLQEMRELGVKVAIDDFGTGYSSLSRLTQLPVDILKIDKSFIARLDDPRDQPGSASSISAAIVALAGSLGLDAVAEGVETRRQLATLQRQHCTYGQGFLLGRPVPLAQLALALRRGPLTEEFRSPGYDPGMTPGATD